MARFTNQVALISGGADGLGKGIAALIASEGGKVVLLDSNPSKLEQTESEFNLAGHEVMTIIADVTSEQSIISAYEEVGKKYGQLHIMVNCAGIVGPTSTKITDYSTEDFDRLYQVNQRGTFLMTKYAVKAMEPFGYGRILLIASMAGMIGYSASKAAVIGIVKSIGKEYATAGITINGLAPAVIKTAMNADTDPRQLEYMVAKIPMGRLGEIDEVAKISAWIVSAECTFTTGFLFDISGGRATY
jgi:3-oxoacyl-[acyl-carrier protein] reductase